MYEDAAHHCMKTLHIDEQTAEHIASGMRCETSFASASVLQRRRLNCQPPPRGLAGGVFGGVGLSALPLGLTAPMWSACVAPVRPSV